MLLLYGNHKAMRSWTVTEETPPGYIRVYYVHGGQVRFESKGETSFLQRGHLYILPSSAAYQMRQDPDDCLECTFMHLDISPFMLNQLIDLDVSDFSVIWHLLNALAISIDLKDTLMINEISRLFTAYSTDRGFFPAMDRRIVKAIAYIAENYDKQIKIEDLASRSGYNSQYFIRIFKEATGLSPHQYIIKFRLKEARLLLAEDLSISEIASRTGFYDVNSFSRIFRKTYQCSPTVCRNKSYIIP